jgi:methylenetetrahydrofolate reductase (NADPH)
MHIQDIVAAHRPSFSLEFFPPRTPEAAEKLFTTIQELAPCRPAFVSVTYGAGGTTRELTHDLVLRLKHTTALDPIPHLTCVGHGEGDVAALLERYARAGVSNLLALRGDLPPPTGQSDASPDAFRQAADLVRAIRRFNEQGSHPEARGFGIGVAGFPEGHPGTPNRLREMDYLKAKVDAGADYICTQLFFDNHDFHDFRARCELAGIRVPIIAGLMPITSIAGLRRMAELAGGARFPARLLRALQAAGEDADAVRRLGIEHTTAQCADLLANDVAGLHFYTLNQSTAVREIWRNLRCRQADESS